MMNKKNVLTCAGGGGSRSTAFTMAEILLSLTIIGVVAAITLPSLTGNINERTWNTQRKALYARFSQAIALMPALNGYGELIGSIGEDGSQAITKDNVAETFVTAGLSKVMKINNICSDKLEDCGVPAKITPLNGASAFDFPADMQALNDRMVGSYSTAVDNFTRLNTKAAAFETGNGESIVVYYNPHCVGSLNETGSGIGGMFFSPKVCANFVYDLNGNKGPNTVGKDIGFITAMYPSDVKVVAPIPAVNPLPEQYAIAPASGLSATAACTKYDSEYRLPNIDELIALEVNRRLIGMDYEIYWSSSPVVGGHANNYWCSNASYADDQIKTMPYKIRCVKR